MKRIVLFLTAVLICLSFSGCSSIDAVGEAQELMDTFVEKYNAQDVQGELGCFHDSLVDDLGGADSTETILTSRRAILGEIKEYEITNTSFETVNKTTEVVLTLSVDYENSSDAEDTYTFLTIDNGLYITGIDLAGEANVEEIMTDYFTDYADVEARKARFIPYAKGLLGEAFELDSQKIEGLAGDFVDYEILSKRYVTIENQENSEVVCYMILSLKVIYEQMTYISDFQLGSEAGEIGINYETMLPETIVDFEDAYSEALSGKDRETLLGLYDPDFFGVLTEHTQDSWWEFLYAPMLNDYGALLDYELVEWDWDSVDLSGEQINCFIVYSQSEYDGAVIQEKIIISEDNGKILGHYVQQA